MTATELPGDNQAGSERPGSVRVASAASDRSTRAVGLLSRHKKYKCMVAAYRRTCRQDNTTVTGGSPADRGAQLFSVDISRAAAIAARPDGNITAIVITTAVTNPPAISSVWTLTTSANGPNTTMPIGVASAITIPK